MTKPPPDYSVPALEKGLEILEALSTSSEPLTLTNLAHLLKRKNNEIFRMVNLLEARRYLLRDDAGGYRLSLRLFQLAHAQPAVAKLVEAAMPALRELSACTGESCHLSVLEGPEIVLLARVESPKPVRIVVELGGRFSALTTASGRMLLAGWEPQARLGLLESTPEFRKLKPNARMAFLNGIEKIAKRRFSTARNERVAGVVDAATSVGDPSRGIHAAVAISALTMGPRSSRPEDFFAPLQKCAEQISSRLGITGAPS